MAYYAIKGGEEAIKNSLDFYKKLTKKAQKIKDEDLIEAFTFSIDKVISEGSLYSKKLASKAIKRSAGDLLNASFFLRAHRSSCQRVGPCKTLDVNEMRLHRRISSAFKDIEGGQLLGASNDYEIKLLVELKKEEINIEDFGTSSNIIKSALTPLREDNLIKKLPKEKTTWDITRSFPTAPYPRSALLQVMSRGESGTLLGFSYTSMRGYGDVHPTIGDLRVGELDIKFTHPFLKKEVKVGSIEATAVESVGTFNSDENGETKLTTGFGFCFGKNETKAISMSIIDLTLYNNSYSVGTEQIVAADFEMIMHHVDGIESFGFCNHYKLPHYVTFQTDYQIFKSAKKYAKEKEEKLK
ncbi:carbon-phosphorus lyase complex subunit PhnI [Halarcobacter anaerophilus]|uniref:Phosphonate metabolism protein n=1 Tax=Halarcobacter anaerophilus TaxID=877500 RepID=A0A4Q0Y0I0_9BACT|nr:carbon-phosphorus lyase complex subunit PhnI [Halarcobacter anaerophilus]QDF28890.1 carbon-phosphorus lyase core complex subunit PhnI [Halarcobacter anaerophilus]RXJ63530.1 phosphonate metabolism protein [Halarcobacter anaerophilus]